MSVVIWITGISGAGKTTLCDALYERLSATLPNIVKIDGDEIRAVFGSDLSYREEDRHVQISRIQRLAKLLSDQNLNCIVSALYSHPDLLSWNRRNISSYFEVYLKASIDLVSKRDSKHLYSRAESGEMTDVVGIDIPWHEPMHPDLVIDCDARGSTDANADRIMEELNDRLIG